MGTKEETIIDLDFTHGEEYVHIKSKYGNQTLCGFWSKKGKTKHKKHKFRDRKTCSCGVPICPTCLYIEIYE